MEEDGSGKALLNEIRGTRAKVTAPHGRGRNEAGKRRRIAGAKRLDAGRKRRAMRQKVLSLSMGWAVHGLQVFLGTCLAVSFPRMSETRVGEVQPRSAPRSLALMRFTCAWERGSRQVEGRGRRKGGGREAGWWAGGG